MAGAPQRAVQSRKRPGTHSGRLLLRMPEALHADLAKASERAGVSLNGFIVDALATALGRQPRPAADRPVRRRRVVVERLLLVNLVVVTAVGVLVIVLLVQALRG